MSFTMNKNRVPLEGGAGLMLSSGFGRFQTPIVTASVSNGLLSLTIANASAQSWYTAAPTVTLSASPTAAQNAVLGTVEVSGAGAVTAVPVTTPGHYYSAVPAITFSGGGGTNAAAVAVLSAGTVASVTVTAGGTGYTSAPTASIAAAPSAVTTVPTATLGNGYVIAVTPGGTLTGYTATPTISFSTSGASIPAIAHAVVIDGALTEVVVDSPGYGYTVAPTVTVTGGGGSATATAEILAQVTGFTSTTFGYTVTPTASFGSSARPQGEVIGVGGNGWVYAVNQPAPFRPVGGDEVLTWRFPKPQENNANTSCGISTQKIVAILRTGTLTTNLPFAANWIGG